jgi:hypothetical protein
LLREGGDAVVGAEVDESALDGWVETNVNARGTLSERTLPASPRLAVVGMVPFLLVIIARPSLIVHCPRFHIMRFSISSLFVSFDAVVLREELRNECAAMLPFLAAAMLPM